MKLFEDIIEKLNKLLYVKPKTSSVITLEDKIKFENKNPNQKHYLISMQNGMRVKHCFQAIRLPSTHRKNIKLHTVVSIIFCAVKQLFFIFRGRQQTKSCHGIYHALCPVCNFNVGGDREGASLVDLHISRQFFDFSSYKWFRDKPKLFDLCRTGSIFSCDGSALMEEGISDSIVFYGSFLDCVGGNTI